MDFLAEDTIVAIATASFPAAISIIRISGKEAAALAAKIFSRKIKFQSHRVYVGKILDKKKEEIDSVLLIPMLYPTSYTGEDLIEIHCHGNLLITKKILERTTEMGARPAEPGEFTLRAFLNKKLDLAQAEAVQQLISAKNEKALRLAQLQLTGSLSERITFFQKELIELTANIEAWLDFPEEDLEFTTKDNLIERLTNIASEMQKTANTFHEGKAVREGIRLCISGAPNVGKSSLMNILVGQERSIVTEYPGTTRDTIEEDICLGSFHCRVIDTAGIRKTESTIEKQGVARAKIAIEKADLILLLLDASKGIKKEELYLLDLCKEDKTLIVWNKIDLTQPKEKILRPSCLISAKEKQGIAKLKKMIEKMVLNDSSQEEIIITQLRHKKALDRAIKSCHDSILALRKDLSPELIAEEIRLSLKELGCIIGKNIQEEILSSIFSRFCVGK